MTTITIPGFVYLKKAHDWSITPPGAIPGLVANWYHIDMAGSDGVLLTIPSAITFEVPDDFDPRPAQVAILKKQQADAAAAFAALTVEINRQINELQAIEYPPEAIDALQTAAFADGFDQAIEQGEAVAS